MISYQACGLEKRYFTFLINGFEPVRTQSQQSCEYHRCKASHIINGLPLYIIIAKANTAYGRWYAPSVMRYTLKRDDIPLLSQWIKKFDKSKLVEFFALNGWKGVWTQVKTNKRCPMKIYHFFENLLKYFSSFLSMKGVYFLSNALKIKCKIISNTMNKAKYPPIVIA